MASSTPEQPKNSEYPDQNKTALDREASPSEDLVFDDAFCDPPIYYFGYGAMANSISRKRRGVVSRHESAAVLSNYQLIFAGGGGATVSPCPGESVHGIVMELTQKGWDFMKTFEKGYNVIEETVTPYSKGAGPGEGQQPIQARLFRMPLDMETDISKRSIPTERYLNVIAAGMKEYGVQNDYIQKHLLNIEFVPSTKPEAYRSFQPLNSSSASFNNLQTLSWSEYQDLCKDRQCFIIDKRIICFEEFVDHPFARWMTANILGRDDCVWTVWNMFLDLSIPSCDCREELKDVHSRWAENHLLELLEKCNISSPFVFGVLE